MFWMFLLALIVIAALFKLGAAVVMVSVLSVSLVFTSTVIVVLAGYVGWRSWRRRR